MAVPTLVVVTGPAGSGKTSLAHQLALAIGCPAICRDEIKEGMAFGDDSFAPSVGDTLTKRTLPVFFDTLRLLLDSGVSTVAEAAFQHHVWAPNLRPLMDLAAVRVIRCWTGPSVARERVRHRASTRTAHADASVLDDADYYDTYRWLQLEVPGTDVDTTAGYSPSIRDLVEWVTRHRAEHP
ncbi:MAG: ATP-binding protein [Acidimicrobiia bacterium]|nr:ATP-binding protein [Acidimicrobiia bacterium]